MPTFAFWNLQNNVDAASVASFASEQDVDVLVLAENSLSLNKLIRALNSNVKRLYFPDVGVSKRLTILTRFHVKAEACLIRDSFGVSIRHYQMPLGLSFLVVAAHLLPSLLKFLDEESVHVITKLSDRTLLNRNGFPDKKIMSDHLPIVCRLNELLEREND